MNIVAVFLSNDMDGKQYEIGRASPPDGMAVSAKALDALHSEWWATFADGVYPDSDSQFVDWLISEKKWTVPAADVLIHKLEG